ncbi:MAG: hypothetical protein GY777_17025 [Candidatus Brocadiaceae bacterium]|nr:hypothetical protein [Candidatus Brocadiaceae bacterium]
MPSDLIQKIASDDVIDTAYDWLCKRRRDYSHNDEVWDLSFRWAEFKPHLQKRLLRGEYSISSQIVIKTPERRTELWSARDALVFKAISIVYMWIRPLALIHPTSEQKSGTM